MLDQAFEALKTFDWGADPKVLGPIDAAIAASHGNASARKDLEGRLTSALGSSMPRAAKDYVCRQLGQIGTAASVPALAANLGDQDLSHLARIALERIPAPEAGQALREALGKVGDALKVGVISSLGSRGDSASVAALGGLLGGANGAIARAAALALGAIRSSEAAQALAAAKPAAAAQSAVTDASLSCAERLLADGKKPEALAIYKRFVSEDHPKHVRLAATRGVLACAGK